MHFIIGTTVVVLFIIIIALCTRKSIKSNIYVCPKCRKRFRPIKRKYSYFGNLNNDSELLKCPKCNKRSICKLSHIQDDKEIV